ncbi:MAG: hypothetical protein AVDCRST_MAG43-152, partial [uncultured Thermomicrobiales bacterium]
WCLVLLLFMSPSSTGTAFPTTRSFLTTTRTRITEASSDWISSTVETPDRDLAGVRAEH